MITCRDNGNRVCIKQSGSFFVLFLWQIWELLCYGILRFAEPRGGGRGYVLVRDPEYKIRILFRKTSVRYNTVFHPDPVGDFVLVSRSKHKNEMTPTSSSFFRLTHGEWLVLVTKFYKDLISTYRRHQAFRVRQMLSKM